MSEWQAIETAPKDGTRILVWRDGGVHIVRWRALADGSGFWDEWHVSYKHRSIQPTHWMPLPAPPRGGAQP